MKKFRLPIFFTLLAVIIYDIAVIVNRFVHPISDPVYIVIGVIAAILLIIAIVQFFMKIRQH